MQAESPKTVVHRPQAKRARTGDPILALMLQTIYSEMLCSDAASI